MKNVQMLRVAVATAAAAVSMADAIAADVAFVSDKTLRIDRDGEALVAFEPVYWGANWNYAWFEANVKNEGGASVISANAKSGEANISLNARVSAADASGVIKSSWTLETDRDTMSTMGIISMAPGKGVRKTVVVSDDGTSREITGGYAMNGLGTSVKSVALFGEDARKPLVSISFEPAAEIGSDGAARIVLVAGEFPANSKRKIDITISLGGSVGFYASPADMPSEQESGWYEWKARGAGGRSAGAGGSAGGSSGGGGGGGGGAVASGKKSVIAMDDWLDKPAGRLGRITGAGDKLMYGGKPIRLWGLNLCYSACSPDRAMAEKRAQFYARYGVNAVRLHKYADGRGWAGIQGVDSFAEFDAEGLDRMDYQIAKFKERGIYTKLSAHFGTPSLGKGDLKAVPYLEEFGKLGSEPGARVQIPASGTYYSREVQDVQIAHYVNLLKHRNPHTKMTYADDPAIAFIEILNEQSAMFYTSMGPLKASATLRRDVGKRFCDWLRAKYRSHDGLVKAWGEAALNSFGGEGFASSGERLDADNILPIGNPWFWDPDQLSGSQGFRRQRLLDSMAFLTHLQDDFNARFAKAVRDAGYKGEIVGSNWQAGRAYSHYMNLHSDALVGTIDRHNYFDGLDNTMLDTPGSGLLSSGLQQVSNRPFMLSEWIHTYPSDYGVEGPAILGAYGMGLQGWDVSFMFQNSDNGAFIGALGDTWAVSAPQIMGVFPAVARQVLRGDILESKATIARYADIKSLTEGKLGFDDRIEQKGDIKEFSGAIAPAALASARCVVDYTPTYKTTPALDTTKLSGATIDASTGQLRWWKGAGKKHTGAFAIDTPATQAYIGFTATPTDATRAKLSRATIEPATPFSAIYITAAAPNATLDTATSLLITAIGRARNTGMKAIGDKLLEKGSGPILMESITAKITLKRRNATVWVLDHDGIRTGEKVPVGIDGSFRIDGQKYKTPYYEVTF